MILIWLPWASRISCTARMSRAERTNEWAMKSTSWRTAHSMKRRSFSVTDGRSTETPGTLTLLRERMAPPTTNSQSSSVSFLPTTRISSSPSAMSIRAPTGMSRTIVGTFMYTTLRVVMSEPSDPRTATRSPARKWMLLPYSSAIVVTRISGPFVSIMIGMAGLTLCTISTMRVAPSSVTWAELTRITSIPASKSSFTNSSVQRKSDMVATIFVFFILYIGNIVILCFSQSS